MKKIPTAVVGASGYIGEQLLGLLATHTDVDMVCLTSRQYAGQSVSSIYPRFAGLPGLAGKTFSQADPSEIIGSGAQFAFLALPHGLAHQYAAPLLQAGIRVLDLSADFRTRDPAVYREFYKSAHPAPELLPQAVYGLPEQHGPKIAQANLVACPGCYPTSILLPLLPLLSRDWLDADSISVASMSGVSGAGRKTEVPYLFAECAESLRAYGAPGHRHLSEIEQELSDEAGRPVRISFVPHLVPVTRGIATTITMACHKLPSDEELRELYEKHYGDHPFIRLLPPGVLPDTKNVTRTNYLDLAWRADSRTNRLLLFSAIDNLVKGAGGQAIQCFNLMTGLPQQRSLAPGGEQG